MHEENRSDFFTELLKFAALAAIIVFPVRFFVAQPFVVSGASMNPTFANGQYLIVDELTYHFADPVRGDVIVFRYPKDPSQFFIKRVIGLPGDTVVIKNGTVNIQKDGILVPLSEPYVINIGNGQDMSTTLGTDEYFVMGDNRPESSDSRIWGILPRSDIIGHVFLRLLPINTASVLPGSTNTHL
ncbi:MAG: signal peptidase signal peptidase [Candidatus Adlerbacteria bacterium]|nr:signal peptidase signal peptidase [Candidatus Adlerbacteria bacterium]